METDIKIAERPLRAAKICEEIFDSVTIYMHLTSVEKIPDFSQISFSNIPFSDPAWKENLHHIQVGEAIDKDPEGAIDSYNIHKKLMLDLAYILTIRGHEVFVCCSKNPSDKNGTYTHFSRSAKEFLNNIKNEKETVINDKPLVKEWYD